MSITDGFSACFNQVSQRSWESEAGFAKQSADQDVDLLLKPTFIHNTQFSVDLG